MRYILRWGLNDHENSECCQSRFQSPEEATFEMETMYDIGAIDWWVMVDIYTGEVLSRNRKDKK